MAVSLIAGHTNLDIQINRGETVLILGRLEIRFINFICRIAAMNGSNLIFKRLIESNASVNFGDNNNNTALYYCK